MVSGSVAGNRTYLQAVSNNFSSSPSNYSSVPILEFDSKAEVKSKLSNAYIAVAIYQGVSYNFQRSLISEGFSSIKVSPLGVFYCLLEETEVGAIKTMIKEAFTSSGKQQ
ncbi:hypothetical protein RYX36_013514 [Vicia faba]